MTLTQDALISIYDAALSDRNWNRALDHCAASMGAKVGLIYDFSTVKDISYGLERASTSLGEITDILAEYNDMVANGKGSGYDSEGLPHIHNTEQFSVIRDDEIWNLDATYRSRPEIALPRRAGLFRRAFVNLSDDPTTLRGLVFLYGPEADEALPLDQLPSGSVFAPHVAKAAEIFRLTDGLRQKYNAVLSVLDQVGTGVLLVSDKSDVIVSNRSATLILEESDGLRSTQGRLKADDPEAEAALRHGIAEASATAKGENTQTGSAVQLPRRGRPPLVAVVAPLRDADMEIERGLTGALVTLIDPERPSVLQSGFVAAAYGLTKAEARVADLMLQGLTNAEISDRIGVSAETIKTQIRAILTKSGCKSRVAFIWRVFQLAPPIT